MLFTKAWRWSPNFDDRTDERTELTQDRKRQEVHWHLERVESTSPIRVAVKIYLPIWEMVMPEGNRSVFSRFSRPCVRVIFLWHVRPNEAPSLNQGHRNFKRDTGSIFTNRGSMLTSPFRVKNIARLAKKNLKFKKKLQSNFCVLSRCSVSSPSPGGRWWGLG